MNNDGYVKGDPPDVCPSRTLGVHSAEWFAGGACEHCGQGDEPAPAVTSQIGVHHPGDQRRPT